jgi:hypothetical protein
MFLFAPAQWLVNLVTVLPDFVRPGVFIGFLLLILWFVFVQRGLPNLWHALCRATARLIDAIVGIVLLPDYLVTTARQKQDHAPGQVFLMIGGVAERTLDGAGALYQRHLHDPIEWKPFPWKPLVIVVAVLTVPWAVMKLTSPKSVVRQELAQGYNVWRHVEDWAGVNLSRRAAPGVVWPPRPRALSSRHHGRTVGVTVHCSAGGRCKGRLVLRNGKGKRLHSRDVSVKPGATATVHMKLSREEASTHRVLVRVARADPE